MINNHPGNNSCLYKNKGKDIKEHYKFHFKTGKKMIKERYKIK